MASKTDLEFNPAEFLAFESLPTPPVAGEPVEPVAIKTPSTSRPLYPSELRLDHEGILTTLLHLKNLLINEIASRPQSLLTLNPTRRTAIAKHLALGAGQMARIPLEEWFTRPLSPAQNRSIQNYLEELALVCLGQVLVLKAWSDRGIRSFNRKDLTCLNMALAQSLREKTPLDREGWQITSRNIYSWYQPSPRVQDETWAVLQSWRFTDEGPVTPLQWLDHLKQNKADQEYSRGYDARLFQELFGRLPSPQNPNESSYFKRSRLGFSPTLRDANFVLAGPSQMKWAGTEQSPYLLMLGELCQLWWGPSEPPLWTQGTGLEAHETEQLPFALFTPKPNLINRIAEVEACEVAVVLEEQIVRYNARESLSQDFREALEPLGYFQKLKNARTSLGTLQACVALTKLRTGGLLIWAREAPLHSSDSEGALQFLFERGCLLSEISFETLSHRQLPSKLSTLPRYLYLIKKEERMEATFAHHPRRILVSGQLRSHIEFPKLIQATLDATFLESPSPTNEQVASFSVTTQANLPSQKEWLERWPETMDTGALRKMETLKAQSQPLSILASVVKMPKTEELIRPESNLRGNGLWVSHLWNPEAGAEHIGILRPGMTHPGEIAILFLDANNNAPLLEYLKSDTVRMWIETHAEKRGKHYLITEQLIKFLPIPLSLLASLKNENPLPLEFERPASLLFSHPEKVIEALTSSALPANDLNTRSAFFVRASRALHELLQSQAKLLSMVRADGTLDNKEVLSILPPSELCTLSMHPLLQLTGNLPLHQPIENIHYQRNQAPYQVRLTHTKGFQLVLSTEHRGILDFIAAQLEGVSQPTWSELVTNLRLPRRWEVAETAMQDILNSHGQVSSRIGKLRQILEMSKPFTLV